MIVSRSAASLAFVLCLGCEKPRAPLPEPIDAALDPAPVGALVLWEPGHGDHGTCNVIPCTSGSCRVSCPPREQMLVVDVQEPLRGQISIDVDGVNVLRKNVPAVPNTGLVARVNVRPKRWPVPVRVRVNDEVGETRAEVNTRFVATRRADGGGLTFRAANSSPSYE